MKHFMEKRVELVASISAAIFLVVFLSQRHFLRLYRRIVGDYHTTDDAKVSWSLWGDLKHMTKIALPNLASKEGLGTAIFLLLFVLKAGTRVVESTVDGTVLTLMVTPTSRKVRGTAFGVGSLRSAITLKVAVYLFGAAVSGCIEHLRHWLITAYRDRLTKYFHERFYHKLVYYHGTALDSRLEAADTVITNYCGEFAEHFAELPYYFVLPLLEAGLSLVALVNQSGRQSAVMMTGVVLMSLGVLRQFSPPFGKIHAAVLKREDDFRKMHTNAITNVELVAMHGAGNFTKKRLDQQFEEVKTSLNEMSLAKGHFEMLEGTITTIWSAAAYGIASISSGVLRNDHPSDYKRKRSDPNPQKGQDPSTFLGRSKAERLSNAVVQLRLINDFNSSVKDFIVNFKEVSHLSEFTTKLTQFDKTLDSVAQGEFVQSMSAECAVSPSNNPERCFSSISPALQGATTRVVNSVKRGDAVYTLISFQNVDVSNPKNTLLVRHLTLDIKSNHDWAIVGPNGCGKSSVLRLLAKLWPPSGGSLTIDGDVLFYFLPQTPYMLPNCTLIEQICFPDEPVMDHGPLGGPESLTLTRKELGLVKESLGLATGSSIVDHLGGWKHGIVGLHSDTRDRSFDWSSLSGGQRQKLAISRAFYHAKIAAEKGKVCICVLDESTSMMDHDAEQMVFHNLRKYGYRFISVTHREEVLQHHTHILHLSRDPGEWEVSTVTRVLPTQ